MLSWLATADPILQALLAGLFTWSVTALGAALVFFMRAMNRALLDAMMGFAAGVMIAASFFSLLVPSIDMAEAQGLPAWLPATVGFVLGGLFLRVADGLLPHLHVGAKMSEAEGLSTSWQRATLLVLAITLHNVPEGLAVGVAFGAAAAGLDVEGATLAGAVTLAVGIGLQNFPEGTSVSMPLRGEGLSRLKSFWYGQLSGAVEPISAVAGAASCSTYALSGALWLRSISCKGRTIPPSPHFLERLDPALSVELRPVRLFSAAVHHRIWFACIEREVLDVEPTG